MENELSGYQVETCSGPRGCPNRAVVCEGLAEEIEQRLAKQDLRSFLKRIVRGPLKIHHELRISVSDCPNACSRPQIADIGLIGALHPAIPILFLQTSHTTINHHRIRQGRTAMRVELPIKHASFITDI